MTPSLAQLLLDFLKIFFQTFSDIEKYILNGTKISIN